MNIVFVRLDNEPVPTGQRDIGTRLLSPSKDRHFSNHALVRVPHISLLTNIYVILVVYFEVYLVGGCQVMVPRLVSKGRLCHNHTVRV